MNRGPTLRILLLSAAGFVALVAGIHRESPRTLVSAHGMLHAAVAGEYESGRDWSFPPENPFVAGEKLPYYWFFQFVGARVAALLGTDPLHAFEVLILLALAVTVVAGGFLAARLTGSKASAFAAGFLILAGCNPQGPILLLARYLLHGSALFQEDGTYLWGLVHPANQQMRLWDLWSMFGPLLTFFLNVTARPLGIASLVVLLYFLQQVRAGRTRAGWLGLLVSSAFLASCSSVLGLGVVTALSGVLLVSRWRAPAPSDGPPGAGVAAILVALWGGLVMALPTFHHLLGHGGAHLKAPAEAFHYLRSMLASSWLLILLAIVGHRSLSGRDREFSGLLLASAAAVFTTASVVSLSVGNEDNWYHAGLVFLSIAAAATFRTGVKCPRLFASQRLRLALLLCAFLPPLAILAFSYTNRSPVSLAFEDGRLVSTDPDRRALYDWVRRATAESAVFVMDPEISIRTSAGNTMEWPALTGRHLLTEQERHYLAVGAADGPLRQELVQTLAAGGVPGDAGRALLQSLPGPWYLVTDQGQDTVRMDALVRNHGPAVFQQGALAVFAGSAR